MRLISTGLEPIPWWLAGALLAFVLLAMLALANRRLGISTGFENVCALVLRSPYFRRDEVASSRSWRLPFLGGLVLGGLASVLAAGGWSPHWRSGLLDQAFALGPLAKSAWMFAGGLLIGFGTRLAGGCTSGHGLFGLANLERASLVATLSFFAAGTATTWIVYRCVAP